MNAAMPRNPRTPLGRHALATVLAVFAALLAGALLGTPTPAAGDGLAPLARGVEGCAEPQYILDAPGTVGQPFLFREGVACLPGEETWSSAMIHWGDGTTSAGTITSVRQPSPEAGFASVTVTGQHTYSQSGSFPITITVTDEAGQSYEGGWHTYAVISPSSSPSPGAQSGPPVIESVGSGVGGEVTLSAHINPDGLETSYEIGLECLPCQPGDQWAKGTLPAVDESRIVTLTLTGVQPGRHWFAVRASNADGEESRRSEALEIPPPQEPFPEGTGGGGIVEAPYLGAVSGQLKEIAVREEEQRAKAKEQEEQKAKELNARPASELEHTEEQPPAAPAKAEHPACLVPALKGDTLAVAGRALARAHCRLGTVHQPAHHHGTLYVSAQSAPAGEQLAGGARVTLTLGAKRASRR
jgi:hypothetical protein